MFPLTGCKLDRKCCKRQDGNSRWNSQDCMNDFEGVVAELPRRRRRRRRQRSLYLARHSATVPDKEKGHLRKVKRVGEKASNGDETQEIGQITLPLTRSVSCCRERTRNLELLQNPRNFLKKVKKNIELSVAESLPPVKTYNLSQLLFTSFNTNF